MRRSRHLHPARCRRDDRCRSRPGGRAVWLRGLPDRHGLFYGLPLPVQPMKAISAVILTGGPATGRGRRRRDNDRRRAARSRDHRLDRPPCARDPAVGERRASTRARAVDGRARPEADPRNPVAWLRVARIALRADPRAALPGSTARARGRDPHWVDDRPCSDRVVGRRHAGPAAARRTALAGGLAQL